MKTCLILEINNNKATVLFPDGDMKEVPAKDGWKVGQTVSARQTDKRMRPMFVTVACIFLAFMVITPFAINIGGFMNDSDEILSDVNIEPSIEPVDVQVADGDLGNVMELIDECIDDNGGLSYDEGIHALADMSPMELAPSSSAESDSGSSTEIAEGVGGLKDFSDTNVQVEGIQEADIIKTDGKYIYAINSKNLVILKANDGNPKVVAKINQPTKKDKNTGLLTDIYIEMFLEGDKLVAIKSTTKSEKSVKNSDSKKFVQADVFDVEDPSEPSLINSLSQSGAYESSRMADGYLYIISNQDMYNLNIDKDNPRSYIPECYSGDTRKNVSAKDIVVCPENDVLSYTNINSFKVDTPVDFTSSKSILGNSDNIYVSSDNIYIANSYYDYRAIKSKDGESQKYVDGSQIFKIPYSNGELKNVISVIIPGTIYNQFNMDEKDGVLRLVTQVYWYSDYDDGTYTALFTLDKNLKKLGEITGIAEDENLYSSRFMGDYAYFVTFLNVDPLFSVDLSDPKNPKIKDRLKIPGFSDYLHPYSDGLLLGLGNDADEDDGEIGSLKLSMFDNSKPSNIKEKHTLIIDNYDYSEASSNHKAILVDADKSIIAFPAGGDYLIFSYNEKDGFKQVKAIEYNDNNSGDSEDYYDEYYYEENIIRGLFIDDVFYIITPNNVQTYDMDDGLKAMADLRINKGAKPVNSNSYFEDIIIE